MALVHGESQDRWYFTKEELKKTPSVLSGIDVAKELSYRQQSANLIQDMGQRLTVSQLTINTAIVYMHRFYMFHSFSVMNRNSIKRHYEEALQCQQLITARVFLKIVAPCCLFLSAKLEEQPRKLEHVIRVAHACLHRDEEPLDPKSERYLQQAQDLVINESVLLQTLGFELTVDHPHTYVVKITQMVRASKDLAQTSYFMATNSLHLTSFCIQHKPSVVACVCIHLACKWSNWEFPRSSDNKDWWEYGDPTLTKKSLDMICQEFLNIIENCPSRLKRRINTVTIYKGGHRPKTSGETSGKSTSVSNNGTATSSKESLSKEESSSRGEPSSKGEPSSSGSVDNTTVEKLNEDASDSKKSDATLTITSSAAVVETPTSKVTLPPLLPLTTKYANIPPTASTVSRPETYTKSSSGTKEDAKIILGGKHKHREHDDSLLSSAKKLKTLHPTSSHGSHSKHGHSVPGRPSSQPKHSSHQSSRPGAHHTTPKLPQKTSSSSHGQPHHSSAKRHGHPPPGSTSHSSSSHSANKVPSGHKHRSGSPLDAKKSSGDRHKRPAPVKPKSEVPPSSVPSASTPMPSTRVNDLNQMKKDTPTTSKYADGFISPPGPQRLSTNVVPRLPPSNSTASRHASQQQPPLPPDRQAAPPPPPPPSLPPPPPPPPT